MSGDYRLFIKVHNGFPEHRKTAGLTDKAFRHLIEAWCFCSRNLTDGKITKAQSLKLFTQRTLRELIANGWMADHIDTYEMLDYLDHQMSAEQVADLRVKRVEAGKRGGQAKANAVASAKANGKQTSSKPVADKDVDIDNPPTVGTRRTATRIPDPFDISQAMRAWARTEVPGLDIDRATLKFVDHWRGKAGKDGAKLDWPATWRNWMRTDHERGGPQMNGKPHATTNGSRPGIPGVGMAMQI